MSFPSQARPSEGAVLVRTWTLDRPDQLSRLRAELFTAVTAQSVPDGLVLDELPARMAAAATELATNALCHAGAPALVQLHRAATSFILDVIDRMTGAVPLVTTPVSAPTGKFGLRIATHVASRLGWYIAGGTKHVWAQFAMPRWDDHD